MTAETAREFAALEAQAQRIMGVFARAGFEAVAPAIIQPAGVFLDAVGEALRARTYIFTDQDGAELCLRPDLTVPTCRLHIARASAPERPARYCYNGAAFRFQPAGAGAAHPREFRQAGIESFGAPDAIAAEAETLAVIVEALASAGLDRRQLHMRFSDLSLMRALMDALDLPPARRLRLQARFGHPETFRAELARMTESGSPSAGKFPSELTAAVAGPALEARLADHLAARGIDVFGSRRVDEVADGVGAILAESGLPPVSKATAELINGYIAIDTPCLKAPDAIAALAKRAGLNLDGAIAAFTARLDAFKARGIDLKAAVYSGSFGRTLAYYTGFVFEVGGAVGGAVAESKSAVGGAVAGRSPGLGANSPVASGGRYDGLMRMAGANADIPAVGAAIHTERLLAAVKGAAS